MKKFISEKVNAICKDFQAELSQLSTFCELKQVRFDGANLPDYNQRIVQQLYLLRYFPAYLVEYYEIYKKVLTTQFLEYPLNILSIGAGCGLDYYGIYFAIKSHRNLNFIQDVRYTGVDIINWEYRDTLGNNQAQFITDDITNRKRFDDETYNVIIFPKSIGEFNQQAFNRLKTIFRQSQFTQNRMFLINSLREQRSGFDVNRFIELSKILTQTHGYRVIDDVKEVRTYENVGLMKICSACKYPDNVQEFVISILERCPGYIKNKKQPHQNDCECLNRKPILRTQHIKFQFVRFERNLN